MTSKIELNARVKITAGPAAGLFGRIASVDQSTWTGDVALDDGRRVNGIPLKLVEIIPDVDLGGAERAKLLDRIRKLHAKAESAKQIGNEAEALTFAAAVQKMLAKYRLSLDDLAMEELERSEPIAGEWNDVANVRRGDWFDSLAIVVGKAHFCRVLFAHKKTSSTLFIIGRATDRKIAHFVIQTIARYADDASDKAARAFRRQLRQKQGATDWENKNYRAAWLRAFVERIAERYRDEERAMEREQQASGGTSLVLVTKKALEQVDEHIKRSIKVSVGKARRQQHVGMGATNAGQRDGRAAANNVNIRGTGIGASAPTSNRSIGKGN